MKRFQPMTLEEIAQEMGITRERVRQIEKEALTKLRKRLLKLGMTPADLLQDPPISKSFNSAE